MESLTHKTKTYKPSFFTSANPAFLLIILTLAIICGSFLWAKKLSGNESKTETAILYLTRNVPRHLMQRNELKRKQIAEAIEQTAYETSIDPLMITTIVFRESSFYKNSIGKDRPSKGLMQVHGAAATGCDLTTVEGQIDCGSRWLLECYELCNGDDLGALTYYATGKICEAKSQPLKKKMKSRMRLYNKLKELFTNEI